MNEERPRRAFSSDADIVGVTIIAMPLSMLGDAPTRACSQAKPCWSRRDRSSCSKQRTRPWSAVANEPHRLSDASARSAFLSPVTSTLFASRAARAMRMSSPPSSPRYVADQLYVLHARRVGRFIDGGNEREQPGSCLGPMSFDGGLGRLEAELEFCGRQNPNLGSLRAQELQHLIEKVEGRELVQRVDVEENLHDAMACVTPWSARSIMRAANSAASSPSSDQSSRARAIL